MPSSALYPSVALSLIGLGMVFASQALGQPANPSGSATPMVAKVEFDGAARPLGKFQAQRARERGEDPKPTPGSRLQAYLAKPEGNGPFPAVVVLHGCRGISALESQKLPELLTSWGFVALSVDSFTARKAEDAW